ncbi:MAG: hypothetical protein ACLTER_12850 [Ruminococcus sp.]
MDHKSCPRFEDYEPYAWIESEKAGAGGVTEERKNRQAVVLVAEKRRELAYLESRK